MFAQPLYGRLVTLAADFFVGDTIRLILNGKSAILNYEKETYSQIQNDNPPQRRLRSRHAGVPH